MTTIGDSKSALEQSLPNALRAILPQTAGYPIEVAILENGRKKRSNASQESWRPANGEIRIRFGGPASVNPGTENSTQPERGDDADGSTLPRPSQGMITLQRRVELIRALRSAEQRPGFDFVALKWFRDLFLPAQEYQWSLTSTDRDRALRSAVDEGIVLTYKVPNPKTPAFPVTAVRLNRQHPEVSAVLRDEGADASSFTPIDIKGEPLSATVLRERR